MPNSNENFIGRDFDRRSFLKSFFLGFSALIATATGIKPANANPSSNTAVVDLPADKTVMTDVSLGAHFRLTASRNFFLANPINAVDGQRVVWEIIQDRFGGHMIKLDDKFIVGSDLPKIVLTKAPHKRDFMTGVYNAASDKWYVVAFLRGY